ncbi:MAG TPA: protein translocase subunit SecF [Spirochaetota bacterium]|nr:protein translocase subunit SecF [Spirochaetota bacterium]HOS32729.1 protein translocase subunit SecF [Spirochaetota bacterium]HOS54615.1 protein translocase subunit SecF [Spirochaetota bacterium]HPK61968.1 protein translocase subunit SecF [Spirochaetota bacterium]HQF77113.1 protein translocase subunit SecF [Spirochaetota bacterium]
MKTNFKFIERSRVFLIFSLVLILISMWFFLGPKNVNLGVFTPRGFNLGVDFQGGIVHQVMIYSGISQDKIRELAVSSGLGNEIQNIIIPDEKKIGSSTSYLIKTIISEQDQEEIDKDPNMTSLKFVENRTNKFYTSIYEETRESYELTGEELAKAIKVYGEENIPGEIKELRTADKRVVKNAVKESQNVISPQYSKGLRFKSVMLVIFVFLILLTYVAFRFKIQYSVGAILALVHDTLIMLGFISFFRLELDMTVLAAIMTLIGYSINDTIVVFDRVRENFTIMKEASPVRIINVSINQTLSRTIMTSLTTLLATVSLLLFAGDKIRGFSLVLTVGIIVGTYSSIFIASPIVNIWEFLFSRKKKIKKEKKDKKIISTEKSVSENKDDGVESQKTSSTTGGSGSAISKKMLKKLSGKKK